MPFAKSLPVELRHAPFSYADGIAAGVTPRRLRNADLSKPFRGIRSLDQTGDVVALARAYAAGMSDDQYFSHLTAAELLGLRMPEGFRADALHVTSVVPKRAPRARGVVGHKSSGGRPIEVAGLRVSSPIATWVACATLLSVHDLTVMADGLVQRNHPLATTTQLIDAVKDHAGQRGYKRLAEAMTQVRARTDSGRETLLRLIVVRAGFPEPEINGAIFNRFGALMAHGDLVYRQYLTILEYDGGQHRTDDVQFSIDIVRLDDLMEEKWRVIRVDKHLMRQRATLLGKIATALEAGGWHPGAT
jgi:very-short-patch-repair endonuclease